jgi:hypothetical protein
MPALVFLVTIITCNALSWEEMNSIGTVAIIQVGGAALGWALSVATWAAMDDLI